MLLELGPKGRKEFVKCRHDLARRAMKGRLDRQKMFGSFLKFFDRSPMKRGVFSPSQQLSGYGRQ